MATILSSDLAGWYSRINALYTKFGLTAPLTPPTPGVVKTSDYNTVVDQLTTMQSDEYYKEAGFSIPEKVVASTLVRLDQKTSMDNEINTLEVTMVCRNQYTNTNGKYEDGYYGNGSDSYGDNTNGTDTNGTWTNGLEGAQPRNNGFYDDAVRSNGGNSDGYWALNGMSNGVWENSGMSNGDKSNGDWSNGTKDNGTWGYLTYTNGDKGNGTTIDVKNSNT